jgi:hypothetical protein
MARRADVRGAAADEIDRVVPLAPLLAALFGGDEPLLDRARPTGSGRRLLGCGAADVRLGAPELAAIDAIMTSALTVRADARVG